MHSPKAQISKVLNHLKKGLTITTWQAIQWWKITRLGRVVNDLKNEGYTIENLKKSGFAKYILIK